MKYFNAIEEEVKSNLFNIFIGISLGNKFLTPKLVKHYISWAHKYRNEKSDVVIFIPDKIDKVNWIVFRNFSEEEAEKKVVAKGLQISSMFEKAKRELMRENNDATYVTKVHTIFWDDALDERYFHTRSIIENEFKNNEEFRKDVLHFVDKYIELRKVDISEEDRDKLAGYIIDEIPILLSGLKWNNTLYNLILYPTYVDSGMSEFILNIRSGKYFDSQKLELLQICNMVEDYLIEETKNLIE